MYRGCTDSVWGVYREYIGSVQTVYGECTGSV